MRKLTFTFLLCFIAINSFTQEEVIKTLVSEGTKLHDQGKYDEAIAKYAEALRIDKNSSLVNYEMSYTYLTMKLYDDAIFYSRKVIAINEDQLEYAYLVLGSSLDLKARPKEAMRTYEEGLIKFPYSNLLNYNLALTAYNNGELDLAETSAIRAILAKPTHGSSHLILASVMQDKGERVKSLLPLYYFLLLEPNSDRSPEIYKILRTILEKGIQEKEAKHGRSSHTQTVVKDSLFKPADEYLGLLDASKFLAINTEDPHFDLFIQTSEDLFNVLSNLKKQNHGIWWDLYVSKFEELVHMKLCETFCYYVSQSTNSSQVKEWLQNNNTKVLKLQEWIKKL